MYADKEKIQTLIDQQRTNLADVEYLDLDSIANIVKDFENPKLSEENSSGKVRSNVAVQDIKQEKATPEQWLKMIEKAGGVKAGEDKWTGLSDWLKNAIYKQKTSLAARKTRPEDARASDADDSDAKLQNNLKKKDVPASEEQGRISVFDNTL